jgi:hypothetical protein
VGDIANVASQPRLATFSLGPRGGCRPGCAPRTRDEQPDPQCRTRQAGRWLSLVTLPRTGVRMSRVRRMIRLVRSHAT